MNRRHLGLIVALGVVLSACAGNASTSPSVPPTSTPAGIAVLRAVTFGRAVTLRLGSEPARSRSTAWARRHERPACPLEARSQRRLGTPRPRCWASAGRSTSSIGPVTASGLRLVPGPADQHAR